MFAVMRHYHFDAKNSAEIDRQIRDGFVPLLKKAKGFVRYYWLDTGKGEGASISVYKDKSFDFIIKTPPSSALIKKMAKLAKASGTAGKETIGSVTRSQVEEIAKLKMEDLNTADLQQAVRTVMGTARSMGIAIKD